MNKVLTILTVILVSGFLFAGCEDASTPAPTNVQQTDEEKQAELDKKTKAAYDETTKNIAEAKAYGEFPDGKKLKWFNVTTANGSNYGIWLIEGQDQGEFLQLQDGKFEATVVIKKK